MLDKKDVADLDEMFEAVSDRLAAAVLTQTFVAAHKLTPDEDELVELYRHMLRKMHETEGGGGGGGGGPGAVV